MKIIGLLHASLIFDTAYKTAVDVNTVNQFKARLDKFWMHQYVKTRQDKTMSVDGLRCILYARIYIPYMRTILYYCIQTGRFHKYDFTTDLTGI